MVVVSHLFFFLRKYFRGRCDSGESHRPLSGTIYFPTAPALIQTGTDCGTVFMIVLKHGGIEAIGILKLRSIK